MNYSDKVNGYQVIARVPEQPNSPWDIILVDRGEGYCRWVTAIHQRGNLEWAHGHYISTIEEAYQDFGSRLFRGHDWINEYIRQEELTEVQKYTIIYVSMPNSSMVEQLTVEMAALCGNTY